MGDLAKSAPPWSFNESTAPEVGSFFSLPCPVCCLPPVLSVGVFGARTHFQVLDSGKVRGYRAQGCRVVDIGGSCGQDMDKVPC